MTQGGSHQARSLWGGSQQVRVGQLLQDPPDGFFRKARILCYDLWNGHAAGQKLQ